MSFSYYYYYDGYSTLILTPSCEGIMKLFFSVELLLLIGINIRQYSIQQHISYRQSSCMHLLLSSSWWFFCCCSAAATLLLLLAPPPLLLLLLQQAATLTTSTISRNAGTRYDCHSGHGERSNSHILCKATWLCFSQGLLNRKSTMARDALSEGTGVTGSVLGFTITCIAKSPV